MLFNSSCVFSNSKTVFCSCRINPPKQDSTGYTQIRETTGPCGRSMLCSPSYFPLLKGSAFLCQSDQSLLYQSNRMPKHFLMLPAEGSPGLLAQHKRSYNISRAFMPDGDRFFPALTLGGCILNSCRTVDTPKHRNYKPQAGERLCISNTGTWTSLIQQGNLPGARIGKWTATTSETLWVQEAGPAHECGYSQLSVSQARP